MNEGRAGQVGKCFQNCFPAWLIRLVCLPVQSWDYGMSGWSGWVGVGYDGQTQVLQVPNRQSSDIVLVALVCLDVRQSVGWLDEKGAKHRKPCGVLLIRPKSAEVDDQGQTGLKKGAMNSPIDQFLGVNWLVFIHGPTRPLVAWSGCEARSLRGKCPVLGRLTGFD